FIYQILQGPPRQRGHARLDSLIADLLRGIDARGIDQRGRVLNDDRRVYRGKAQPDRILNGNSRTHFHWSGNRRKSRLVDLDSIETEWQALGDQHSLFIRNQPIAIFVDLAD